MNASRRETANMLTHIIDTLNATALLLPGDAIHISSGIEASARHLHRMRKQLTRSEHKDRTSSMSEGGSSPVSEFAQPEAEPEQEGADEDLHLGGPTSLDSGARSSSPSESEILEMISAYINYSQ